MITAAECNTFCTINFNHPNLVAFKSAEDPNPSIDDICNCLYSGGATPSFTPPMGIVYTQANYPGTGPVMKSDVNNPYWQKCYAYAQVSNNLCSHCSHLIYSFKMLNLCYCYYRELPPLLHPPQPMLLSLHLPRGPSHLRLRLKVSLLTLRLARGE